MKRPPQNPTERDGHKSGLWRLATVSAWIVFVLAILLIGFRTWFQWQLGPATRAEIARVESEIVTLPPEWQKPGKVPPQAVLDFQASFVRRVNALREHYVMVLDKTVPATSKTLHNRLYRYDDLYKSDQLTSADRKLLAQFSSDFIPLVNEASAATEMPGYTSAVHEYVDGVNRSFPMSFSRLANIAALLTADGGYPIKAMEIATVPVKYFRGESRRYLLDYLTLAYLIKSYSGTMGKLAERTSDVAVLRRGLDLMDSVSHIAHPDNMESWQYLYLAPKLAYAQAAGYPVDLSPQPLIGLIDQVTRVEGAPFNEWVLKNLPPSDFRREKAQENLYLINKKLAKGGPKEKLENFLTDPRHNFFAELLLGVNPAALDGMDYLMDLKEFLPVTKTGFVCFELARLRLAQRLAELENPATKVQGPAAVEKYIGAVPIDPLTFSEASTTTSSEPTAAPLLFSRTKNQFYSVGPDGDDDMMKVQNTGGDSDRDGDIFLGD